ncbi:MAG: aldehyde dehydrogenase family protein [Acetobacter malorum]|uniref:aldehyde dehydrogenase family protein n=1 Tax=Acetobacter TaxID=434 RepID=UPI001FD10665|nr:aldehyde dehydrogenase family protein [Acetobacter fabarum]
MDCLKNSERFFINGQWVSPSAQDQKDIINPATEKPCGRIALAHSQDVNRAIEAAHVAFETWSTTTRAERLEVLRRVVS